MAIYLVDRKIYIYIHSPPSTQGSDGTQGSSDSLTPLLIQWQDIRLRRGGAEKSTIPSRFVLITSRCESVITIATASATNVN